MTDPLRSTPTAHTAVTETPGPPGGDGLIQPGYEERRTPCAADLDTGPELAVDGAGE